MAGGGGAKKLVINYVLDNPVRVYFGGAAFLYAVRRYQIATTYNKYFGKIDFTRKVERNELH
eukprot:403342316